MKELGEYLKKTRISNGVSLEEAAEDLSLSSSQLENIESGNTKAFKDIYNLKDYVRQYAKYLGLDPDKVVDEFNDFLFQHTSKISLDDIKEAQKKLEDRENARKVKSPYTKEYKKKVNIWPFVIGAGVIILFIIFIYLIISHANKIPNRDRELISSKRECLYEFTY